MNTNSSNAGGVMGNIQLEASYEISVLVEEESQITRAFDVILEFPQQLALSNNSNFIYFIHDLRTIGKVSTISDSYEVVYTVPLGIQLQGIAITPNQTIYYSDENLNSIYRIQNNGVPQRVAGTASTTGNYNGNNRLGTISQLNRPIGLFYTEVFDSRGEVYFADETNHLIRKFVIANATVVNVAGNNIPNYAGDGGLATQASLRLPSSVFVSNSGEIYIADTFNCVIRKVSTLGIIETIAGVAGQCGFNQDSIDAKTSKLNFPTSVVVSNNGDLFIADRGNHAIRKVSSNSGLIETVAGGGFNTGYGISGTSSQLNHPSFICLNAEQDLFISDTNHHRILKLSNGIITLVSGLSNVEEPVSPIENVKATIAKLKFTYGVATNSKNEVFISDAYNHRIVKIDNGGMLSTIAGRGVSGFNNNIDGMLATEISLNYPYEIAIHPFTQDLYISDTHNHRILRVDSTNGRVYRFMGNGIPGYSGEGSDLLNLQLNNPSGISFSGNSLIISDTFNHRIRRVLNTTSTNLLGSAHGGREPMGTVFLSNVMLKFPSFAFLQNNILTVSDTKNYLMREFDILSTVFDSISIGINTIHTPKSIVYAQNKKYYINSLGHHVLEFGSINQVRLIGTITKGFFGDYQSGTVARMRYPNSMCLDNNGDFILSDTLNSIVRRYSTNTTIITTIAGIGTKRLPDSIISEPKKGMGIVLGVAMSSSDDFYFTDISFNRVLKGNLAQRTISTLSGPFIGGINENGPIPLFKIHTPTSVFVYNDNLYVIDNSRLIQYSKDGSAKTLFSSFSILRDFLHVDSSGKIYFMEVSSTLFAFLYTGFESNFQIYSGNGTDETSDGIDRSLVSIYRPSGLFYHEQKGEIYYSDAFRIRKFSKDGIVSTVAGRKGSNGYTGEYVPTTDILASPKSIYVNSIGEVFFLDGNRVRKISTNGTVFTIAGNGTNAFSSNTKHPTNTTVSNPFVLSFNSKSGVFAMIEGRKRLTILSPYCSNGFSLSANDTTICIPVCFGLNSDGGACGGSNQGLCIAPDTCSCFTNWNGTECEIDLRATIDVDTTNVILIATLVPTLSVLLILAIVLIIVFVVVCVLCRGKKAIVNSVATVPTSNIELKNSNITLDMSTTTGTISDYPDDVSYFFKPSMSVQSVKSGTGSTLSGIESFNPLSRYTDIQKIGEGGFGSVFKCLNQEKKTKVLKAMRFNSYAELSMFMKEGLQLLNMNHPNIVKVNDLFIDKEELLFIEMEYYEKGDLNYLLKNPECCNETILRQIITQMGKTLDFIHNEKKIIHRDIKPSNLFIKDLSNANIQVILADFGLARENSLSNKSYAGTPIYCSPELGLGSNYGPETDIYSLGVTLYQIISRDVSTSISHYYLTKDEEQVAEILKKQMKNGSDNKYSDEVMSLIIDMVRRDPSTRPKPKELVSKFE